MLMILIELTSNGEQFILRADQIESIRKGRGNTSEITMVSGREYTCLESPVVVATRISEASEG